MNKNEIEELVKNYIKMKDETEKLHDKLEDELFMKVWVKIKIA